MSRTSKLPNGVTVQGAAHFNLGGDAGVMPHDLSEQSLLPTMLYTSKACIGQLTGTDVGNSAFKSSSKSSPDQTPPSKTTVLSKKREPEAGTEAEKLSNRVELQNADSMATDAVADVELDICDRPDFEQVDSSKFESSAPQDQRRRKCY